MKFKGKAAVTAQRNERLAHRNPQRLQSQIDKLKAQEASSGHLPARDKKALEDLEKELARVNKARGTIGYKRLERPLLGQSGASRPDQQRGDENRVLGKRGRQHPQGQDGDTTDTDESAKGIPMPRDTPPPVPTRRRHPPEAHRPQILARDHNEANEGTPERTRVNADRPLARTVYESKPIVRDLRKEAASFLPSAVRRKVALSKAHVQGKYLEAEEMDALEEQGYRMRSRSQAMPEGTHLAAKQAESATATIATSGEH